MSAPHVTTGGGASIGENVNAGGDFTGRDKVTYGEEVYGDKVMGDKIVIRKVSEPPSSIIWLGLIVVICSFLLFIANEAALPFWLKTFHPFLLPLLLISFVFVFCMFIWKFWARNSKENTSDLRGKLLDAVFTTWLDPDYGILSQSVYSIARVNLILEIDVKAVDSHGKQFTQPSIQSKQLILSGTDSDKDLEGRSSVSIIQAYEKFAGKMLILGKPGSGKTTLLLELASELIKRAKKDYSQPIPVIFHLSTWASRKDPFEQWLVTELTKFYGLSTNIAEDLILNNKIAPLLDGLDEMEEHARQDCVGAINHYRSNGRGIYPIVICCRRVDYERLHTKLQLTGAINIQSISELQIDTYLRRDLRILDGLRTVLQDDHLLKELIDNVLMLSIAVLAYDNITEIKTKATTQAERRRQLFEDYIEAMFARPRGSRSNTPFVRNEVEKWLSFLARQTGLHQDVYFIESMQPTWLSVTQRRRYYRIASLLKIANNNEQIVMIERLRWDWQRSWHGLGRGMKDGMQSGLAITNQLWATGLGCLLALTGRGGLWVIKLYGAIIGLVCGLIGALDKGLGGGFVIGNKIETKTKPNQGLHQSLRNALYVACVVWLVISLPFLMIGVLSGEMIRWVILGTIIGIILGVRNFLRYGGRAVSQHILLRLFLHKNGSLPIHLVSFLECGVERIFLVRVGGGYRFIHSLLRDHLSSKYCDNQ